MTVLLAKVIDMLTTFGMAVALHASHTDAYSNWSGCGTPTSSALLQGSCGGAACAAKATALIWTLNNSAIWAPPVMGYHLPCPSLGSVAMISMSLTQNPWLRCTSSTQCR